MKQIFSFLLCAFCAFTCSTAAFAQTNTHDRIIFTDSSKVTAVVKAVNPPEIQYADFNAETQKEGALHNVSIMQVARIEYANGRIERNESWLEALKSKEQAKVGAVLSSYYGIGGQPKPEARKEPKQDSKSVMETASNYERAFIVKTNLVDDLRGIYNVGAEYTIGKNFSVEGEIGLVLQNESRSHVVYENGFNYPLTQNVRTSGLALGAAIKWYTGYSNRWTDMILNSQDINGAPHGLFLSIRDDLRLMGGEQDFIYNTLNLPKQTVKSELFLNSISLCLGYQQTRLFKVMTFETYAGLGFAHRTSPAVNITSPAGVDMTVVQAYNGPGITAVGGFTIGIDINALKRKN